MSKVTLDISMSLDGFVTASDRTADEPLGKGGERLHDWLFHLENPDNLAVLESGVGSIGAVITGRRNYDDSLRWWDADGPSGEVRVPVFVVTHAAPESSPEHGVYTFVTDGIEGALDQACAAAGDKGVCVMGGADIAQQFIAAKLVDEISIHLAPVVFGSGLRLFEDLEQHLDLEVADVVSTPSATHLLYRVRS